MEKISVLDFKDGREYRPDKSESLFSAIYRKNNNRIQINLGSGYKDFDEVFSIADVNFIELESLTGWYNVPSLEDEYYFIDSTGNVRQDVWLYSLNDKDRFKNFNCFKDRKTAVDISTLDRVQREISKFKRENDIITIDWTDSNAKYGIAYDYERKIFHVLASSRMERIGGIYFSERDLAKRCINEILNPLKEGGII